MPYIGSLERNKKNREMKTDKAAYEAGSELDRQQGAEIARRARKLQRRIKKARSDLHLIMQEAAEMTLIWESARLRHKSRPAWWLRVFAKKTDLAFLKRNATLARRNAAGENNDRIESWMLRLLGVVDAIHHKDKPKSQKSGRRYKPKSALFYINKAHEAIVKAAEQEGEMDEEQRERRR